MQDEFGGIACNLKDGGMMAGAEKTQIAIQLAPLHRLSESAQL
jgi:hypothetical protein